MFNPSLNIKRKRKRKKNKKKEKKKEKKKRKKESHTCPFLGKLLVVARIDPFVHMSGDLPPFVI